MTSPHVVGTQCLGSGSYGTVWAGLNSEGEGIAIKYIPEVSCGPILTKRALREVIFLRLLRNHDNIISLDQIYLLAEENNSDLYIFTDLMDTNLESIIHSGQVVTAHHVIFFVYQLLRGLLYVHTSNVIHRDIKPANILVNESCRIKICDFGLSKLDSSISNHVTVNMTNGVTSRWYRAPEVFLGWDCYTKAIDMWAVGCVVAELVLREPIFRSQTSRDHVQILFYYLGTPSEDSLHHITDNSVRAYVQQHRRSPVEPLRSLFPDDIDPECLDFITGLLRIDPSERLTVSQALRHPYMKSLHLEADEPVGAPIDHEIFSFDTEDLGVKDLLDLIRLEQERYHGDGSEVELGGGGGGENDGVVYYTHQMEEIRAALRGKCESPDEGEVSVGEVVEEGGDDDSVATITNDIEFLAMGRVLDCGTDEDFSVQTGRG